MSGFKTKFVDFCDVFTFAKMYSFDEMANTDSSFDVEMSSLSSSFLGDDGRGQVVQLF